MVNRLTPDERWIRATDLSILVDSDDEWILSQYTWRLSTKGYVETTIYDGPWRCTAKLHHFIIGRPIDGSVVDHRNRNKLDNRRDNLRYVDGYSSAQNVDRIIHASNIRVTWDNKFEVRVTRRGMTTQVGTFATKQEAQDARDKWFKVLAE